MPTTRMPTCKKLLADRGVARMQGFCKQSNIDPPNVVIVPKDEWFVDACAYYRTATIHICLEECQHPCGDSNSRNWTWPGSTIDREPFGVIQHELGHHVDKVTGKKQGNYGSEFSVDMMNKSGEKPLTGYCPNPWEWFAEMFRLFVTNHALLRLVRPKTWKLFQDLWTPVSCDDWVVELGPNVPERVVTSQRRKFV